MPKRYDDEVSADELPELCDVCGRYFPDGGTIELPSPPFEAFAACRDCDAELLAAKEISERATRIYRAAFGSIWVAGVARRDALDDAEEIVRKTLPVGVGGVFDPTAVSFTAEKLAALFIEEPVR